MVHHITLFKLKPEVTPEKLEKMMMTTRMSLLKIPEILAVKCGKAIANTFLLNVMMSRFQRLELDSVDRRERRCARRVPR